MTKFYYKTLHYKPKSLLNIQLPLSDVESDLNKLGEIGWELVSFTIQANTNNIVVVLKNTDANLSQQKTNL